MPLHREEFAYKSKRQIPHAKVTKFFLQCFQLPLNITTKVGKLGHLCIFIILHTFAPSALCKEDILMMMCALSYSLKFPWLPTNQPGRQPANRPYTLCVLSFSAFFSQGNNSILATQMRQQKSLVVVIVIIERTRRVLTSRIKADAEFSDNFVCIIRFFPQRPCHIWKLS